MGGGPPGPPPQPDAWGVEAAAVCLEAGRPLGTWLSAESSPESDAAPPEARVDDGAFGDPAP